MPIDLCAQMHKDRTQSNCGAIHQHKFTRWADATDPFEFLMYLASKITPGLAIAHLLDRPHAVFKQWGIDETGLHIENINRLIIKTNESPAFIGVDSLRLIIIAKRFIKLNHPGNKFRTKQPD